MIDFTYDYIHKTPDSSAIDCAWYDKEKSLLAVSFKNGNVATYVATVNVWDHYVHAASVGKFYNSAILNNPAIPGQSSDWDCFVKRTYQDTAVNVNPPGPKHYYEVTVVLNANSVSDLGVKLDDMGIEEHQLMKVVKR